MMMLVDYRIGSKDLAAPLRRLGAEVSLTTLEYGDVAFFGSGPEETNVDIGVERKTLSDLLSSIQTGRLMGHQVPGLTRQYDYPYLLVEGIWRPGAQGILEVPRGTEWVTAGFGRRIWMYGDLVRFLNSVSVLAGVRVVKTATPGGTAQTLHALASWWEKPWGQHKSLRTLHATPTPSFLLTAPSATQTLAAQIPGVGWEYSAAVEQVFGSAAGMVGATVQQWAEVRVEGQTKSGRRRPRIGEKRATKIVAMLRGE